VESVLYRPYPGGDKPAINQFFSSEIIDLLQIVESHAAGLVKPVYL